MEAAATLSVSDLARDEGLAFRCFCGTRTFRRDDLVALVGADARLHLIGLRRELWCRACREPPLDGPIVVRSISWRHVMPVDHM
ncbi:hypothetical protein [Falsiroseomonas sp. HW251]|uniref:hypothetical protein n=1 Tax=Falsiroseomonas sp. HW251 TaxID=3390998 RepID=UPI003D3206F8